MNKTSVLVAEDEKDLRKAIRAVLEEDGYVVYEAATGSGAFELFEKHQGDIGLVVADLVMPEGSGVDLVNNVTAVAPRTPIVIMSGYADILDSMRQQGHGNITFLNKPFGMGELLGIAAKAVGRSG